MFEYCLGSVMNSLIDQAVEVFDYDIEPTEEDVWEIARTFEEAPSFTNIFLELFFNKLADKLWEIDDSLEFDWETNCNASYFNYRFDTFENFKPLEDLYDFVENLN